MKLNLAKKNMISEKNLKDIIKIGINFGERLNQISEKCVEDYKEDTLYSPKMLCIYNNYIWECKYSTQGTWDNTKWTKLSDELSLIDLDTIKSMLGLTSEEITTLQSLILDTEIRLDKTHSSSRIFSDMQDILSQSKTFTLDQFAKASKASYQVITNLSSATDKSIIYLMANGSNYDMYIVESDGTPVKIGDTTIDLSQFYTKTEIDNDFLKKTDADGKFATIKTVDKKAEKTDLDNHINDTDIHITANERTTWNGKIDKNTFIKLNDLPNGSYCSINSFIQNNNEFVTLDIVKSDGTINRLELTNAGDTINHIHYDGTNWIKVGSVCTTKVADIPTTTITPTLPPSVKIGKMHFIRYSVKNGWANVSIIMNLSASPKLDWFPIASNLPKPDKEINFSTIGESNANIAPIAFRLEKLDEGRTLEMMVGAEFTVPNWYNVNFSYPVAES